VAVPARGSFCYHLTPVRVAITAYCVCNGLGRTTVEVLDNLGTGRHGLRPCPLQVPFETMCGVVPGPLPALPERHTRTSTRQLRIGWLGFQEIAPAVAEVIERRGPQRVGAIIGTSTGGIAHTEHAYFAWRETATLPTGYDLDGHSFHTIGRMLRDEAGWRGPTYVVSTACSSSAKVFASARRLLRSGRCDAVLVGGVDSLALTTVRGFHSLSASSASFCRPFAAQRDGMNVGEGAAYLLLERDGPARGHLVGIGESNDAFHMSAPDPEGRGAVAAMQAALADAGLHASDIDYINAHGTGTVRNDVAEARAIAQVLGRDVPVVSTKSYTGHMLGAGGATEAVFALASLEQQWIPANLGVEPVDPEIGLELPSRRREARIRHVLSNSFAFGGSNVTLAFSGAST
jgi:3-oxoacyl-[acyl-carrier-protein] synthase-1